jgi:glucose-fructose oxidoreductase
MSMTKWRIAGINFDHFHMGDNLRFAFEHPECEIVGICDQQPERMRDSQRKFAIPPQRVYTDAVRCLEETRPDIVVLCPAAAEHGRWTEIVAPHNVHIIIEKPFAASLSEADQMIRAMQSTGKHLIINWPLAWYRPHRTAKRLIDEGCIGQVIEVHFYDGNRGPLWHVADKVERTAEEVAREKPTSWFYKRAAGGGSLLDYLGYGTTLGTWFLDARVPLEVTAVVDQPADLEVDEHAIVVARYEFGLSKFETRWGTFTDPWSNQPQPKCGFVLVGTEGTISSYDYQLTVRVQSRQYPGGIDLPVDRLSQDLRNPVAFLVECLKHQRAVEGPVSVGISRIGQQIVDSAVKSAAERRTVQLLN